MRFWARVQAPVVIWRMRWKRCRLRMWRGSELAEQAVALEAFDRDREYLADDVGDAITCAGCR